MKKCAVYARVSSLDQLKKQPSTKVQLARIKKFVTKNKYKVSEIFVDSNPKAQLKPAFSYMLEKIKQGKIKTLITQNLDRVIRSYCDSKQIKKLFRDKGIRVINLEN